MHTTLSLIGRDKALFDSDLARVEDTLSERVSAARFLVLGGAGSIGQAVCRELFKRDPRALHVVDISENNLVELVRDLRSTLGYISGDFQTFALDIGSVEFDAFIRSNSGYDYVLNLSALKHVRSEKDPFTLMRMIDVNVLNVDATIARAIEGDTRKYFCVSTDKAANPANMMGASKRIMEMFLMQRSADIPISTARFANVAFSDGSLLHSFNQRLAKRQPIAAPRDVKRYFITPQESGELCLLSCLLGDNRDIFFPKLNDSLHLIGFPEIVERYLRQHHYEPVVCESEEEARTLIATLPPQGKWPCVFSDSDTTGEKDFEEFYCGHEVLDFERFDSVGIIQNEQCDYREKTALFENSITAMRQDGHWNRQQIVDLFHQMIPDFQHRETGKYLDGKM